MMWRVGVLSHPGPAEGCIPNRRFVAVWHFLSAKHIQLGFHLHLTSPNIEIHLPFGFIRIGWLRASRQPVKWVDVGIEQVWPI